VGIFDNPAGTAHCGPTAEWRIRVVYVSARRRQRRKAFRLRWMGLIDGNTGSPIRSHLGSLSFFRTDEAAPDCSSPRVRFHVRCWPAPRRRRAPMPGRMRPTRQRRPRARIRMTAMWLVVRRRTGHPATAMRPSVPGAARTWRPSGRAHRLLGRGRLRAGPTRAIGAVGSRCRAFAAGPILPHDARRRLIVANGGSTLLQAIASGKPLHRCARRARSSGAHSAAAVASGVAVASSARGDRHRPDRDDPAEG